MEVKYCFEPEKGVLILMFEVLVKCPNCGANSKYAISPTPKLRKNVKKEKPKTPDYIG
jgi:hypothetical protein